MGKKVKEYKSGDFIFAKVKGYPAWPARVQKQVGKKYFVYFYGTGETAHLPPNMIFDYAENKDKFLSKTVKRKLFNDGVQQIEHDFANNVPLEQVVGLISEASADEMNDVNDTLDESAMDTTADDTINDTTLNDTIDDANDTGALVIEEGKKGRKSKADLKTPAKETAKVKEIKTPRGKTKKDDDKEKIEEETKPDEEITSRSGRKIRPKRFVDEQTEENSTLPSPTIKKRRGASPADKDQEKVDTKATDKTAKQYHTVTQSELEGLKEPFAADDGEKKNILIAYLPSTQYVGIRLFQSRPTSFKNDAARLQWDKQAAANAVKLKHQLEKGHITPQSVLAQLEMDLNLTDEEKATLDKEREIEEKKSRVQFLKTEMKLIELDAKIKTCLSLEKADTELCLKLLDELLELEVKPLMLLKHPTCLETVKRMRAYVGNTPSWDLSEEAALEFSKQAHSIRKQADTLYKNMKELFSTPDGLSFWEFFSERVLQFKKITSKLNADELLEMVHEPPELALPAAHKMKSAIEAANEESIPEKENPTEKKISTPAKSKKPPNNSNSTPKSTPKRQSSRNKPQDDKESDVADKNVGEKESEKKLEEKESKKSDEKESKKSEEKESKKSNEKDTKKLDEKDSKKFDEKETKKSDEKETKKSDEKETKKKTDDKESKKKGEEKEAKKKIEDKETKKKDDKDNKKKGDEKETKKKSDEKDSKKKSDNKDARKKSDEKEPKKKSEDKDSKSRNEKEISTGSEKQVEDDAPVKKDTQNKFPSENKEKDSMESKENNSEMETESKNEKDNTIEEETSANVSNDQEEASKKKKIEENVKEIEKDDREMEKSPEEKVINNKRKDNGETKVDNKVSDETEKEKVDIEEPRAKRSRESKKTETLVPRSPAKRKSKS